MQMSNAWYPQDKKELNGLLEQFLSQETEAEHRQIHGLIVPHAGYAYSGALAGKAYAMLKNSKHKKAIILAPSHYFPLSKATSHTESEWITALGKIRVNQNGFERTNISQEHAIDNQIPFLQKLGFREILPLVVGEIDIEEAREIAEKLAGIKDSIIIISTDLSHFLPYEQAIKKDKETIKAIESLDAEKLLKIDNCACGIFPLLALIELCGIKKFRPKLLEYKNSGDITGDKSNVVGYACFAF